MAYSNETTVILDLGDQSVVRTIRPARELPEEYVGGYASEDAIKATVGAWGLPDFVFHPAMQQRGTGNRELGDALLLVGNRGLVVQAKHREHPTSDPQREANWVIRNVAKAHRQARGSIRSLMAIDDLQLSNLRGREVSVPDDTEWLGITILDYPNMPPNDIGPVGGEQPFVVERQFWDFLFDQLRCTSAVLDYIWRRADLNEPYGSTDEFMLFFDLTIEDQTAAETQPARLSNIEGRRHMRVPQLPVDPTGDELGQTMFRLILEDLSADGESDPATPAAREADRLHEVLSSIDRTPLSTRQEVGERLVHFLQAVDEAPVNQFRSRFIVGEPPAPNIGFVTTGRRRESTIAALDYWLITKHAASPTPARPIEQITSWALLMTPHATKPWSLDFRLLQGDPGYSDAQLAQMTEALGLRLDPATH